MTHATNGTTNGTAPKNRLPDTSNGTPKPKPPTRPTPATGLPAGRLLRCPKCRSRASVGIGVVVGNVGNFHCGSCGREYTAADVAEHLGRLREDIARTQTDLDNWQAVLAWTASANGAGHADSTTPVATPTPTPKKRPTRKSHRHFGSLGPLVGPGAIGFRMLYGIFSTDGVLGWERSEEEAEAELQVIQQREPDLPVWVCRWPALLALTSPYEPWDEMPPPPPGC